MKLIQDDKRIVQANSGDVFGNLLASFGIDLKNTGTIRLKRMIKTSDSSIVGFGLPAAFALFANSVGTKIYAIAGADIFANGGTAEGNFLKLTSPTGAPTTCTFLSDLKVFNSALYITQNGNDVYKLSSLNSFSSFSASSTGAGVLGKLLVYALRMYKTTGGTSIVSWDTADTVATLGSAYTLQLAGWGNGGITVLLGTSNRIWVGTLDANGEGAMFEWDGVATTVTNRYLLKNAGAVCGCVFNDAPYIFDSDGVLRTFIGGGFKEVARLPLNGKSLAFSTSPYNAASMIHHNGMQVVDDEIWINLKGTFADGHVDEMVPSGIWAYHPDHGLYHKMGFSLTNYLDTSISDFGQFKISKVGALKRMKLSGNSDGSIMAGAEYFSDATTIAQGSFVDHVVDTYQKAGYFLTPRIEASNLKETWGKLFVIIKKFLTATDKIVLKYRFTEDAPTEATITWTQGNTFTTTGGISGYAVGDEVEIVQGFGAGLCAHITTITNNAGTYTVVLDESFINATGTAKARFAHWIKIGDIDYSYGNIDQVKEMDIPQSSQSLLLKVWMTWTGDREFRNIVINNKQYQ